MSVSVGSVYLSADSDEATWQLFDHTFHQPDDEADIVVMLAPRQECYIEVVADGLLPADATAWVSGLHTTALTYPHKLSPEKRTDSFWLVDGSQARVALEADGYWTAAAFQVIKPGRNIVEAYPLGTLHAPSLADLGAHTSLELGLDVGSWIQGGRVTPRSTSGGVAADVPIGDYSWTGPDGVGVVVHVEQMR